MTFWSHDKVQRHLTEVVSGPRCPSLDCNAIPLTIGPEIYVTPHLRGQDPEKNTKIRLIEREPFTIPAGQFAFLITEEVLKIPPTAMGFISVRTSIKFKGLVNISGFHVEPGYRGRLIFAALNAGPAPIHLQRGDAIFRMWLADLDGEASSRDIRGEGPNNEVPDNMDEIPTKFIQNIPGKIHSLQSLSERIDRLDEDNKVIVARAAIFLGLVTSIAVSVIVLIIKGS